VNKNLIEARFEVKLGIIGLGPEKAVKRVVQIRGFINQKFIEGSTVQANSNGVIGLLYKF